MTFSLDISYFPEEISCLSHSIGFLYLFFFCIIHSRPFYFSVIFSGTLHSTEYIFPFLPCHLLFVFPQLFVKLPQTTTLPSCISFSFGWFRSLSPVQLLTSVHSSSITLSTRPSPLNLCVTSTV